MKTRQQHEHYMRRHAVFLGTTREDASPLVKTALARMLAKVGSLQANHRALSPSTCTWTRDFVPYSLQEYVSVLAILGPLSFSEQSLFAFPKM